MCAHYMLQINNYDAQVEQYIYTNYMYTQDYAAQEGFVL